MLEHAHLLSAEFLLLPCLFHGKETAYLQGTVSPHHACTELLLAMQHRRACLLGPRLIELFLGRFRIKRSRTRILGPLYG